MQNLKVVAVASSEETRSALYGQLQGLGFVDFEGVLLELSDTARQCQDTSPDVIIVDMTGRELDAGLFMQTIGMNPEHPCTLFALHNKLDHQTIVDAVQSGAKEFVQYPDESEKLEQALRKYLSMINRGHVALGKPKEKGRLITVFSAKGGSGCSTVAVNVAYELRKSTQESVALFDLDQVFSNTAVMLNLMPNYSVGDLGDTTLGDIDENLMKQILVEHPSGFQVVVGSKNVLDDHEMISHELLEHTVDYLVENHAYVIVDLPTHVLDPYHQYMIERSDEILVVSALDVPGLSRTRQYLDLARQYLDMSKLKLILNRWSRKAAFGMSNESLEAQFNYPIYARLGNDWDLCVEANSLGSVLSEVKPNSELAKELKELSARIGGLVEEEAETDEKESSGLLSKLFKKKGNSSHVVRETELG